MGTCSWKYPSWEGLVYSQSTGIDYLKEYAEKYRTVEIDQWFWSLFGKDRVSLPRDDTVLSYKKSVPEDFIFTIKVPNSITLTHFYNKKKDEPLVENPYFLSEELFLRFCEKIEPIKNQCGPLMFQFEYLNKKKMPSLEVLLQKLEAFFHRVPGEYCHAIELRNPNFLNSTFFAFLQRMNLSPVFLQGYYMPPVTDVYAKFQDRIEATVIIRLHGPSRGDIEKKTKGRWDRIVESKDHELPHIAGMIGKLVNRQSDVFVNVNNHYEGSAPLTIGKLKDLIGM
jgi:uncharacterized protein YecE (DUF72 family)